MVLQSLALFFGTLTMSVKFIEKHLMVKVRKHEKLKTLIEAKSNSIKNLVSKAYLLTIFQTKSILRFLQKSKSLKRKNLKLLQKVTNKEKSLF